MPCVVPRKYFIENGKSFLPDPIVQTTFLKKYLRTFQNMFYI